MSIATAKILTIRDALLADCSAAFASDFTAAAAYSLVDDDTLRVMLGIQDLAADVKAQDTDEDEYQLAWVVRKKVDPTDPAQMDPLVNIAMALHARYPLNADLSALSVDLQDIGQVVLIQKRFYPALYNQHMLDATGYFQSTLVMTLREWVDK